MPPGTCCRPQCAIDVELLKVNLSVHLFIRLLAQVAAVFNNNCAGWRRFHRHDVARAGGAGRPRASGTRHNAARYFVATRFRFQKLTLPVVCYC